MSEAAQAYVYNLPTYASMAYPTWAITRDAYDDGVKVATNPGEHITKRDARIKVTAKVRLTGNCATTIGNVIGVTTEEFSVDLPGGQRWFSRNDSSLSLYLIEEAPDPDKDKKAAINKAMRTAGYMSVNDEYLQKILNSLRAEGLVKE